jgi:hypothetical protein
MQWRGAPLPEIRGCESFPFGNRAGRVTLNGQPYVPGVHPDPVIDHNDTLFPRDDDLDVNVTGSGVKRVFHEFPDHRRGTLDDLACRYQVDKRIGQDLDFGLFYTTHIHIRPQLRRGTRKDAGKRPGRHPAPAAPLVIPHRLPRTGVRPLHARPYLKIRTPCGRAAARRASSG